MVIKAKSSVLMVFLSIYQQYNEKQAFIDPILSLINTSICGPGPPIFLPHFICLSRGKPPPEDVLDMFKWFFPILPKMPNLMLIVYLPKIFSSVAGLFRLDPLHLLSAGTVLTLEPSVRCVSGVLVCVPHPGSL